MSEKTSLILEIKVSNQGDDIKAVNDVLSKVDDKLGEHMVAQAVSEQNAITRDHELQMAVGQITVAVTNLSDNVVKTNESLTTIATMATESRNQIVKYDTWITAIVKIAGILGIIIGGLFTLVQYVESKNHESLPVSQIPAHVADEISNAVKPPAVAP